MLRQVLVNIPVSQMIFINKTSRGVFLPEKRGDRICLKVVVVIGDVSLFKTPVSLEKYGEKGKSFQERVCQ